MSVYIFQACRAVVGRLVGSAGLGLAGGKTVDLGDIKIPASILK